MKRHLLLGTLLFLLLLAIAAFWSWRAATERTRQFENILLAISTLPEPPAIAEPVPAGENPLDPARIAALDVPPTPPAREETMDPAELRQLQDRARDAHRMILEHIPADLPERAPLLAQYPSIQNALDANDPPLAAETLNQFILGARDLLAAEYARRTAATLSRQLETTLTPASLALLKNHPTPESTRALKNIETAKTLPPPDAIPLLRDALADLETALPSAHQARYNSQLNELQNFAEKAFDGETPILAAIPLRALATHRPNDPVARSQLARAEALLNTHLQNFFLLRGNSQKTADFQKILAAVQLAANSGEPLCAAALALTRGPPDLVAAASHVPFLRQHDSPAALFLSALYHSSHQTLLDPAFTSEIYLQAAELGFLPANLPAALFLLENPEFETGDPRLSTLRLLQAAAAANDPAAQCELAFLHLHGRAGLAPDPATAHHWFVQSANRGNARAQVNLGLLLMEGRGAAQNIEAAVYWFQKAADQNDPLAQYNLGLLALRNILRDATEDDTARLFAQSAEAGFAPAQRYLAGFHLEGRLNFPKDPALAFQWAQKAADQDDPAALLLWGMLKFNGIGTSPGKGIAAASIIKAANLDHPEAMYAAGILYIEGDGIPKNPTRAREWILRASEAGYPQAKEWLEENP